MNALGDLDARAHELRQRARTVAAPLVAEARTVTTLAGERAVLRLFGVAGVDREGRPLDLEAVERFSALAPGRLAGGIALPFAAAAHEYELEPQDLALEIAAGHIDLALEAELLAEPERRQTAERTARRWLDAALARFEANRTARRELADAFGEGRPPLVAADLGDIAAADAARLGRDLARAGIDIVRLRVPRDRELRRTLGEEPHETHADDDPSVAPAGSQRGLSLVRDAIDEASMECGRYVSLGTLSGGLSAPESAVVAGFERVDVRWSDPLDAIVVLGIAPKRAIADHLQATEIDHRSGVLLALGSGPAALASELAEGAPVDRGTRGGRALALQALSVELSVASGLPAERVLIGALPLAALGAEFERGLPELALRRLCFPGHPLSIEAEGVPPAWTAALGAWLTGGTGPRIVVVGDEAPAAEHVRTAVRSAEWLGEGREIGALRGDALAHARAVLDAALATLRGLAAEGWESFLGAAPRGRGFGADGIVLRRGYFEPFPEAVAGGKP